MKKHFYIIVLVVLAMLFNACEVNDEIHQYDASEYLDLNDVKYVTYNEIYDKFLTSFEQESSSKACEVIVNNNTDLIIDEISTVYCEIINIFEKIYDDRISKSQPAITYEEYEHQYVQKFTDFYHLLVDCNIDDDAYISAANAMYYGGTAASLDVAIWKYVNTYNALIKLTEYRNYLLL